mgnify:CR=1 FL=1
MICNLACRVMLPSVLVLSALALPASPAVQPTPANLAQDPPGSLRAIDLVDSQVVPDSTQDEFGVDAIRGGMLGPSLSFDFSGDWQLSWDDSIDGQFVDVKKSCTVKFQVVDGAIAGKFEGPVQGTERNAIFTGEVLGSYPALLNFTQREPGYTCTYQILWAPSDSSPPTGTWHDTRGASGEFTLLKQQ